MMSKLLIKFNASAAKDSSCLLRTYRTVIEGYREPVNNNDMEFGTAFHLYISTMKRTGGDFAQATALALESYSKPMNIKYGKAYMTKNYLLKTCQNFWTDYVSKDQFSTVVNPLTGEPLVELKFAWPYYSDDKVEVLLCGTIDDICKQRNGCYAVRDYKTTSVYKWQEYFQGYWLSPQLMFYRLAIRNYALAYPDSIFAEINRLDVGCFIEGIFCAGADKDPEFRRSEVMMFPPQQLAEFEKLLHVKIMSLVEHVKNGTVPDREGMLNGACTTVYGPCKFSAACKWHHDTVAEGHMLRNNFIQTPYNPLQYD